MTSPNVELPPWRAWERPISLALAAVLAVATAVVAAAPLAASF